MGGSDAKAAARVGAAAVFRLMNRPDRAEELCGQVLRSDPEDPYALNALGGALSDQQRHEEADAAFAAAKRAEQQDNR
jgi:tetratricopeptide (TPR) repeat protein